MNTNKHFSTFNRTTVYFQKHIATFQNTQHLVLTETHLKPDSEIAIMEYSNEWNIEQEPNTKCTDDMELQLSMFKLKYWNNTDEIGSNKTNQNVFSYRQHSFYNNFIPHEVKLAIAFLYQLSKSQIIIMLFQQSFPITI